MRIATAIAAAAILAFGCQRATDRVEGKPDAQGRAAQAGSAGPAAAGEAGSSKVTLLFSGSIAGQLVPCGCSPDQLGGLPRGVALVKKLRAATPNLVYIDAGDLLFESAPGEMLRAQAELKAKALARGEALMGAAARAVGARDLVRGPQLASGAAEGVPLLDAGGMPVPGARDAILVKAGAVPIGFLAGGLADGFESDLAARVQRLRAQGARIAVLLYLPKAGSGPSWPKAVALQGAAKAAGIDLIVLGHRDDLATDAGLAEGGSPPVLAPQGHFQQLVRVDLQLPKDAAAGAPVFLSRGEAGKKEALQRFDERIARLREQAAAAPPERKQLYLEKAGQQERLRAQAAAAVEAAPAGAIVATATFLPLDATAGEDAEAKALVAAYDDAVSAMNFAAAQKQPEACPPAAAGEAFYAGLSSAAPGAETSCATCHKTQTAFWLKTGHAHAWKTLVNVKKDLNLDCVRCHVTGWQQPGGVCRIDKTALGGPGLGVHDPPGAQGEKAGLGRRDVQCEACHGPSSEHAKDPPAHIKAKVAKADCLRCHEASNSPHFDHEKYLPGVVGPGHGAPLAQGQQPGPVWPSRAAPSEGKPAPGKPAVGPPPEGKP